MNKENFEFKVGDRVMIEGVLEASDSPDYPLLLSLSDSDIFLTFTHHGLYKKFRTQTILKLIERPTPKLTFEFIRNNLVPMKHILINNHGFKFLYLGFNRFNKLVTDCFVGDNAEAWDESDIQNWTYEEYNETKN